MSSGIWDAFSHFSGVFLILVALVLLFWLPYLSYAFSGSQIKSSQTTHRFYYSYTVSIVIWILSNAYFQSNLLINNPEQIAVSMAIIANLFCFFALLFGYLFSVSLRESENNGASLIGSWQKALSVLLVSLALILNLTPGLTVQGVDIQSAGHFVIEFGPYNGLFFLSAPILILLTLVNLFQLRSKGKLLLRQKTSYMIAGVLVFMGSTLIVLVVIPVVFGNFDLVWLPPALSVTQALLIGYAMRSTMFFSLRYLTVFIFSRVLNSLIYLLPILFVANTTVDNNYLVFFCLWTLITGISWSHTAKLSNALLGHVVYLGQANKVQQIYELADIFRFSTEQGVSELERILDHGKVTVERASTHYVQQLRPFFSGTNSVLIKAEIEYKLSHQDYQQHHDKLLQLWQLMNHRQVNLLLPMYEANGHLSHVLMVIQESQLERLISVEEIQALQILLKKSRYFIAAHEQVRKSKGLVGSMAHEIRNPLSKLSYHFDRMNKSILSSPNSSSMKLVYDELFESKKAVLLGAKFIEAILSEANGDGINSEQFHYYSLAKETLNAIDEFSFDSPLYRQRVNCHFETDCLFKGSDTLYCFVIFNLLKNASHYFSTYLESEITVTIYPGQDFNRLEVVDTGPGIDPKHITNLFDDYFTYGKPQGSGLGLAYCKKVIESFGGNIRCESELGKYSKFIVQLPNVETQWFDSGTIETEQLPLERCNVLIIGEYLSYIKIKDYLKPLESIETFWQQSVNSIPPELFEIEFKFIAIASNDLAKSIGDANTIKSGVLGAKVQTKPLIFCGNSQGEPTIINSEDRHIFHAEIYVGGNQAVFLNELVAIIEHPSFGNAGKLVGKRVLVVDDMVSNQLLVQTYLQQERVVVDVANSGLEAVEKVHGSHYDAILMDTRMPPGIDGIEATRLIRRFNQEVPILSLSGESIPEIKVQIKASMNDYLDKPVDKKQLIEKLVKWSTSRHAPAGIERKR